MLSRLIYISRACASEFEDVAQILDFSRVHNASVEVTGTLCHLDHTYIEHLEGDEQVISALFDSIRSDPRHRDVTVLDRRMIPRRAYPGWSLAMMKWDVRTKAIFRSFSPGQNLDVYASDPTTAAPLVRALTRSEDWTFVP